jgi:hypothetical protein
MTSVQAAPAAALFQWQGTGPLHTVCGPVKLQLTELPARRGGRRRSLSFFVQLETKRHTR